MILLNQKYDEEKNIDNDNRDDINHLVDEVHKLSGVMSDILDELQVITRKNRRYSESSSRTVKWISIVLVFYAILLILKTVFY